GAAVAIGVGGVAAEVDHGRAQVLAVAEARGCRAAQVEAGDALRGRLGQFDVEPAAALLRAATGPAGIGPTPGAVEDSAREHRVALRTLAHAANGVVRIAVARAADVGLLVHALRPRLESGGGSLVVHRAIPEVKEAIDVWGAVGGGVELMRRIKNAFDPDGLLAPGRLLG